MDRSTLRNTDLNQLKHVMSDVMNTIQGPLLLTWIPFNLSMAK